MKDVSSFHYHHYCQSAKIIFFSQNSADVTRFEKAAASENPLNLTRFRQGIQKYSIVANSNRILTKCKCNIQI